MSWQLAAWLLLAAVLVGGFGWYERSRPPSQVIALVAALAALAVAGRLALAPLPNVVATTDIVLLTGYAVGAGPGFAVGALAALVSNFALGQGPWTPWQMAAWGGVGLAGSALAALVGRGLGRWPLAAACGLAGIAFGAVMNLSLMVSFGGEQTLDRFLALSARAIPFDLAHAAGNVAFALLAAPVYVRMLLRFRARFEVLWIEMDAKVTSQPAPVSSGPLPLILLLAGVIGIASVVLGVATTGASDPARSAAAGSSGARAWLEGAQNRDGGFGKASNQKSDPLMTAWAGLGLAATGRNPLDVRKGGETPISYLEGEPSELSKTAAIERTILLLRTAGENPARFAGKRLIGTLRQRRAPDGNVEGQVNLTAFAILALRAAGDSPDAVASSGRWLRNAQNTNGGWGSKPGSPSEADSTGAVVQALATLSGANKNAIKRGASHLRDSQRSDGGWGLRKGDASNSQSTAWAVQGLLAAGIGPGDVTNGGKSPFDYLAARQAPDGHYRYSSKSDQTPVWVTAQAVMAVERKSFPLAEVASAGGSGDGSGGSGGGSTGDGSAGGGSGSAGSVPIFPDSAGGGGAAGIGSLPIPEGAGGEGDAVLVDPDAEAQGSDGEQAAPGVAAPVTPAPGSPLAPISEGQEVGESKGPSSWALAGAGVALVMAVGGTGMEISRRPRRRWLLNGRGIL